MTAGKLLNEAISSLRENGIDEPEANAQWLLSAVLKKNRAQIILNPETEVSPSQEIMFGEYIRQKKQGIPLAYILGTQDFIDITLKVDSRVLVPRPETEELAEYAAEFISSKFSGISINILDYGAGSGAIGFWLLKKFPNARLTAADKSAEALECAKENARQLRIYDRTSFANVETPNSLSGHYSVIVSNPPYIPSAVIPGLSPEVLSEPYMALDGGSDGLSVARLVLGAAGRLLVPGGGLFMELSGGDPLRLKHEASNDIWKEIRSVQDFSGQQRFFVAIKA